MSTLMKCNIYAMQGHYWSVEDMKDLFKQFANGYQCYLAKLQYPTLVVFDIFAGAEPLKNYASGSRQPCSHICRGELKVFCQS